MRQEYPFATKVDQQTKIVIRSRSFEIWWDWPSREVSWRTCIEAGRWICWRSLLLWTTLSKLAPVPGKLDLSIRICGKIDTSTRDNLLERLKVKSQLVCFYMWTEGIWLILTPMNKRYKKVMGFYFTFADAVLWCMAYFEICVRLRLKWKSW